MIGVQTKLNLSLIRLGDIVCSCHGFHCKILDDFLLLKAYDHKTHLQQLVYRVYFSLSAWLLLEKYRLVPTTGNAAILLAVRNENGGFDHCAFLLEVIYFTSIGTGGKVLYQRQSLCSYEIPPGTLFGLRDRSLARWAAHAIEHKFIAAT